MQIEKMRAFIIRFVFYCIVIGLGFVILKYAMPFLMPFLVAFFIAFLLQPVIRKITQSTRLKRKPAAVLTLILFYILVATFTAVIGVRVSVFIRDTFYALPRTYETMLAPALEAMQNKIELWMAGFDPNITELIDILGNNLSSSLSSLVAAVSSGAISLVTDAAGWLPSFIVKFVITLISSFYFVVDYRMITSFFVRQLPKNKRELIFTIKRKTVRILQQFGRAYAMLMTITFAEMFIGMLLLRVPNALLISLGTALVDIFPILGTGTILIPWGIIELIMGRYPMGAGLLILYGIITVVRQTLEPRVVGRQIGLYPLLTLVCMFVGTYLFGVLGLFGLPIIATVLVELNKSGDIHIFK